MTHIQKKFEEILTHYEFDLTDPNFEKTPQRMANMFEEFLYGHSEEAKIELKKLVTTSFPATIDEMILVRNIKATGLCPHHFLPVSYTIHVAYVSDKTVIGLSKIPRIVQILSKRAVIQETLSNDIAQFFMENLAPKGVAVQTIGVHSCMSLRGVKALNSDMVITTLLGCLRNSESKLEFLQMIK